MTKDEWVAVTSEKFTCSVCKKSYIDYPIHCNCMHDKCPSKGTCSSVKLRSNGYSKNDSQAAYSIYEISTKLGEEDY